MIKYKGIPENTFSAYFALYTFSKPKITEDEFVKIKKLIKNGSKVSKDLINYKVLEII